MRSLVFATRYAATPMACTAVLYRPTTSPPHRDREVYALIVWRMLDSQYAFSTMSKSATLSLNPVPRVCTQSSSFSAPSSGLGKYLLHLSPSRIHLFVSRLWLATSTPENIHQAFPRHVKGLTMSIISQSSGTDPGP
jgi:hypothetical protein